MKTTWLPFVTSIPAILAMPTTDGVKTRDAKALACACVHNNDAVRWWDDPIRPDDQILDLCNRGGACRRLQTGNICVHGDLSQCECAAAASRE
ncbi:hypothetical protein B0T21DRAFT_252992, partial [Apiosordaria backusii]